MAIDFTLTDEQRKLQLERTRLRRERARARSSARPTRSPTRSRRSRSPSRAYVEAYKRGIAFCMLPRSTAAAGCRTST